MHEALLRVARALLLAFSLVYAVLVIWPVGGVAYFLNKTRHELDRQLLIAGAERRTRNERKTK